MLWGKSLWTSIHLIALAFPEAPSNIDRENYKRFYASLGAVLPCYKCQQNFERHWRELPIDAFLFDRKSLFAWTVKFHNLVSAEIGKATWTVDEAWKFYSSGSFAKADSAGSRIWLWWSVLLLVALLLLFAIFAKKKRWLL